MSENKEVYKLFPPYLRFYIRTIVLMVRLLNKILKKQQMNSIFAIYLDDDGEMEAEIDWSDEEEEDEDILH
jgi:hypothetical protein